MQNSNKYPGRGSATNNEGERIINNNIIDTAQYTSDIIILLLHECTLM